MQSLLLEHNTSVPALLVDLGLKWYTYRNVLRHNDIRNSVKIAIWLWRSAADEKKYMESNIVRQER